MQNGDASPLDLGDLGRTLGFLLRIAQLKAYEDFFAGFGPETSLRPGEFSALWLISTNPGIKQGVVAETLRIKPAHMSKIVRRYEDEDIIRREIPENDRRSVTLSLTPKGQTFVQNMRPAFIDDDSYHDHGLTGRETRDLVHLLRRYVGLEEGAAPGTERSDARGRTGDGLNSPAGATMGGKT